MAHVCSMWDIVAKFGENGNQSPVRNSSTTLGKVIVDVGQLSPKLSPLSCKQKHEQCADKHVLEPVFGVLAGNTKNNAENDQRVLENVKQQQNQCEAKKLIKITQNCRKHKQKRGNHNQGDKHRPRRSLFITSLLGRGGLTTRTYVSRYIHHFMRILVRLVEAWNFCDFLFGRVERVDTSKMCPLFFFLVERVDASMC